jgi:hypothetical protein
VQQLVLEALAEGQEEEDGHGAPRNGRDGEDRPFFLELGGPKEELEYKF